jgi:hypothetical protein
LNDWLRREQHAVIDLLLLLVTAETVDHLAPTIQLGWKAKCAALAIALLVPARHPASEASPLARWGARLPWQLTVSITTGVLLSWWLALPLPALSFIPLWVAATLLVRLPWAKMLLLVNVWYWLQREAVIRRWDILAVETTVVGSAGYLANCYWPHIWPSPWLPGVVTVMWPLLRALGNWHQLSPSYWKDLTHLAAGWAAIISMVIALTAWTGTGFIPSPACQVVSGWCVLALATHRALLRITSRTSADISAENIRWGLLLISALWLMRGFARYTLHGTGDALWYGTMLADMVAQTRAGVFPVWLGQSLYQFNGAIYPLRIAPAFHYLGVLLDTLTMHTLGVFALQNLLITLLGVGAIFSAFFGLGALLPGRRWLAAGLAVLYLSCPGVLGIAYNTDLFMSWTTLPCVPLVWFATVRSFRDGGALGSLLLLGGSLGLCWWGHSPIALWMTLLAGAMQLVRVAAQRPHGRSWLHLTVGAVVFLAVSAYPLGSVLLFPPEPGVAAASFQAATPGTIVYFLREAFPAVLLPLSSRGRLLGDFQLGYALWGILLFSLWHLRRIPRLEARLLLGFAVFLAVLLTPFPGLDFALWNAVPGFIRNITGNWVMNRLYLVLASTTIFGVAVMVAGGLLDTPLRRRALAALVALGSVWSMVETIKFTHGSRLDNRPPESAVDMLRPENVLITRFAYLIYPRLPDTFSHGVMDPQMEHRLLARDTFAPIIANSSAALAAGREISTGCLDRAALKGGSWLELTVPLTLEPGRRYLLACEFLKPARTIGVLQLAGRSFFREYALPEYGEPRAFGAGARHATWLSLWTTAPSAEKLTVRFYPAPEAGKLEELALLIHTRLLAYEQAALPVRVESWVPYRARVRSQTAAWLETPRMYQTGYTAVVSRVPASVCRSPQGLVCIAVPAGDCTVELSYRPPRGLVALFWMSMTSMLGLGAATLRAGVTFSAGAANRPSSTQAK